MTLQSPLASDPGLVWECKRPSTYYPGEATEAPEGTPDEYICKVCLTNKSNVVVLPCGHVSVCIACARGVVCGREAKRICPMCRKGIECVKRAFT